MHLELDIVRAWKDVEYRRSLSPAQLAAAGNPVDMVEVVDDGAGESGIVSRSTDLCGGCRSQASKVHTVGLCCC